MIMAIKGIKAMTSNEVPSIASSMHHDPEHKVGLKPLITLRPKYGMRMS